MDSQTGTDASQNPTDPTWSRSGRAGATQGSSTTSAAGLPGPGGTRSRYDPNVSGFNPSTGSGYATTGDVGTQRIPSPSASSYNTQDYRGEYAPSTANKEYKADGEGRSASKGEEIGRGVRSAIAGIHGAGESLRGALNAAVDKAFGYEQGAAKNEQIANRGEQEMRTGSLSSESSSQ